MAEKTVENILLKTLSLVTEARKRHFIRMYEAVLERDGKINRVL
jgi:hypothetical protein